MVYNTLSDAPYNCDTYAVGHDGFVNKSDLFEKVKNYEIFPNMGEWYHNQWVSYHNICKGFYLTEQAKQFKIKTELTILLRELPDTDTVIDCGREGKNKSVYYYETTGGVVICIEAGSHSCFDNSSRLSFYKQFDEPLDLSDIKKIILEENNRIVGNVNPDSNHNYADEQMCEARMNALISNS